MASIRHKERKAHSQETINEECQEHKGFIVCSTYKDKPLHVPVSCGYANRKNASIFLSNAKRVHPEFKDLRANTLYDKEIETWSCIVYYVAQTKYPLDKEMQDSVIKLLKKRSPQLDLVANSDLSKAIYLHFSSSMFQKHVKSEQTNKRKLGKKSKSSTPKRAKENPSSDEIKESASTTASMLQTLAQPPAAANPGIRPAPIVTTSS